MTMFTALAALTDRASLHMMIVAEGDKLRVTVQPKPTGKGGTVPPALMLIGIPEELDREFAAAIGEYKVPASSVLEQAKAQAKTISEAKPKAAAKPAKPAVKKAAKPTPKPKPAAAKKSPAKKPAAKPAKAAPAPKAKAAAQKPRKDALPLEDLLAMARTYLLKIGSIPGKKPSRADFIKNFPKGRRYERLFKTFDELVDAARQQELPIEAPAAAVVAAPVATDPTDKPIVFAGTTGETEYLKDPTGNRRFWPVEAPAAEPSAPAPEPDMPELSII